MKDVTTPPRLAEALLEFFLPEDALGDSILGDLSEDFRTHAETRSLLRARAWYWTHAFRLMSRFIWNACRDRYTGADNRRGVEMNVLFKDLVFGARSLTKKPGSAILSVVVLALGIGLCTTTFSLVYGVFLRGLGVEEQDRLTLVGYQNVELEVENAGVPMHDYHRWREQQRTFKALGAWRTGTINVSGTEGPERFQGARISANAFDILGERPVLGRTFLPGEDGPGMPPNSILSYRVWQDRYGGDAGVIGTSLKVNGEVGEIIGVMREGFFFPQDQELWIPLEDDRAELENWGDGGNLVVFGRLADGMSFDQAELDMAVITKRIAEEYPDVNEGWTSDFYTFRDRDTGPELRAVFGMMLGATFFVLLIACANVANLLMARATMRMKEAAVRTALGASRWRVILPFFSEAVILSTVGAVLGIGIAFYGVSLFSNAVADVGKPYYMLFAVDLPILIFVSAVAVMSALISGAAPALQVSRTDVNSVLKDESRGSSGLHSSRLSRVLVLGQVALSCALLVGAGLMIKSVVQLTRYEYPFATENVFTARVGLFETDYPTREDRHAFFEELLDRLAELPEAESAAIASALPGLGGGNNRFTIEGGTYTADSEVPRAIHVIGSPDYFTTVGNELVRGRGFTRLDTYEADFVIIVNQLFADLHFPGEDPIGRRIRLGGVDSEGAYRTIIGIAPNLRMEGFGPSQSTGEGFYTPFTQANVSFMALMVRSARNDVSAMTRGVRAIIRSIDADLPMYQVGSLRTRIDEQNWFYKVFGTVFMVFGAAALFMASVGLYGVLSFSVSRRIREMGIRMALGAASKDVLKIVMTQGIKQILLGLAIGLVMAFGLTRIIGFIMFDVNPRDPTVFGGITLLILFVGIVASVVPALKATSVDPVVALRAD